MRLYSFLSLKLPERTLGEFGFKLGRKSNREVIHRKRLTVQFCLLCLKSTIAKIDLFKETCHKFLAKINDPKIATERLKKDMIKLVMSVTSKLKSRTLGSLRGRPKVFVGMSGGVDSSMALLLLKQQGFLPIGVSLKYAAWNNEKNQLKENVCCTRESFNIAKEICQRLDAAYHIVDYSQKFKDVVMDYFLAELKEKKTPNPCLICNRDLKFKELFKFAKKEGGEYVATGHYARIRKNPKTGQSELLMAKDKNKDQSYFLCLLTKDELNHLILPAGDYLKDEIYEMAKENKFDFFNKTKQSQDLCFVSGRSMPFYLEEKIGIQPGPIFDVNGHILGRHQGLHFYTIGQRRGINLSGGPWWVVDFDKKNNGLIVSRDSDDSRLYKKTAIISKPHFISGKSLKETLKIQTKVRYRQDLVKAALLPFGKNSAKLVFDRPQRAVTPGQWAVFYEGEVCLGGGVIK